MGSAVNAVCECGYNKKCTIGGTRAGYLHDSRFPYYCDKCGVVSANIQNDPVVCPCCDTVEIVQYGGGLPNYPRLTFWQRLRRGLDRAWSNGLTVSRQVGPRISECNGRWIAEKNHLCPSCKSMSLRFIPTGLRFD